jgi:hypothetical protein
MAREPYPLPIIRRHDYDTFRSLDGFDLPDTYDEWFNLHTNEKRERNQAGFDVVEVEVNPSEFARFCRARGGRAQGQRLLDFTIEKFAGNNY